MRKHAIAASATQLQLSLRRLSKSAAKEANASRFLAQMLDVGNTGSIARAASDDLIQPILIAIPAANDTRKIMRFVIYYQQQRVQTIPPPKATQQLQQRYFLASSSSTTMKLLLVT